MSEFSCEVSEQGGGLVLKLGGQMTLAEMDDFDREVARVAARRPSRIVLDLADLRMISSAGIGALLKLQRRAQELKCDLRLAAPPFAIEDVLRKARLDAVFTIVPTVGDAMN
jgi:anti-sigma B factor antagonist